MNYTDKYLIHDISNKAFKLKYGAKRKSKKKEQKPKKYQNSKKERQEWWRNFLDQQTAQHEERMKAHCKRVKLDYFDTGLHWLDVHPAHNDKI